MLCGEPGGGCAGTSPMRTSEQHQRRKWGLAIPTATIRETGWQPVPGAATALQGRRAEHCCPTTGQGNERGASAFLLRDNLSQGGAMRKGIIADT